MISEKENTCAGEFRHFDYAQCIASLNSRSLSWLSEVETNGGGIFIPVNRLSPCLKHFRADYEPINFNLTDYC
ncbi:MAG: hypothetical protein V7K97_22145 [Nostoc sp.]|uniref:hypothetical protein n=1 Tax=Nostoc sp. TaxID=1180 RepID=UPI002FF5405E